MLNIISKQDMPEQYDAYPNSPITSQGQGSPLGRDPPYPPPTNISQYASRELPRLPTLLPRSSSPFAHRSEEDSSGQHSPQELSTSDDRKASTTLGAMDEDEDDSAGMWPAPLAIPNRSKPPEHQRDKSPQSQHSDTDSKLIAMWTNGDEHVSPIDASATASWKSVAVSPLSDSTGRVSMDAESWFENSTSDKPACWNHLYRAQTGVQSTDAISMKASHTQMRKTNHRHSDPGSPLSAGLEPPEFEAPGLNAGGRQHHDGAQKIRGHNYTQSMSDANDHGRSHNSDVPTRAPRVVFRAPNMSAFPPSRPGVVQRPISTPLKLKDRPILEDYAGTSFPPWGDFRPPPTDLFERGEPSLNKLKPASGLSSFGATVLPSTQRVHKPPPGFTEVISHIDYHGGASSVPRVKNPLSKAKQGLGINAEDFGKAKKRDEFERSVDFPV